MAIYRCCVWTSGIWAQDKLGFGSGGTCDQCIDWFGKTVDVVGEIIEQDLSLHFRCDPPTWHIRKVFNCLHARQCINCLVDVQPRRCLEFQLLLEHMLLQSRRTVDRHIFPRNPARASRQHGLPSAPPPQRCAT